MQIKPTFRNWTYSKKGKKTYFQSIQFYIKIVLIIAYYNIVIFIIKKLFMLFDF